MRDTRSRRVADHKRNAYSQQPVDFRDASHSRAAPRTFFHAQPRFPRRRSFTPKVSKRVLSSAPAVYVRHRGSQPPTHAPSFGRRKSRSNGGVSVTAHHGQGKHGWGGWPVQVRHHRDAGVEDEHGGTSGYGCMARKRCQKPQLRNSPTLPNRQFSIPPARHRPRETFFSRGRHAISPPCPNLMTDQIPPQFTLDRTRTPQCWALTKTLRSSACTMATEERRYARSIAIRRGSLTARSIFCFLDSIPRECTFQTQQVPAVPFNRKTDPLYPPSNTLSGRHLRLPVPARGFQEFRGVQARRRRAGFD